MRKSHSRLPRGELSVLLSLRSGLRGCLTGLPYRTSSEDDLRDISTRFAFVDLLKMKIYDGERVG